MIDETFKTEIELVIQKYLEKNLSVKVGRYSDGDFVVKIYLNGELLDLDYTAGTLEND